MNAPELIVVGSGIGGLSTACYAQMSGYRVRVFEMHSTPGGVCTAWKRNGYVFDGCIHNLAGSSEHSPFHQLFRDLGVVPALPMHAYPELVRVDRQDGESLTVFTDLDRLQQHMTQLAPADGERIAELVSAARKMAQVDLLGLGALPARERAKALRAFPLAVKYGGLTLEDYARQFRDPFLRKALPTLMYDWPKQRVLMLLGFLGGLSRGDLGWPMGGSLAIARAIERRFVDLGGEVVYGARVQSILVENDCAVGVRLADGSEERADRVVFNGYGPACIFDMLGGRYTNRAIRHYYGRPDDRIEMGIHVSLGVARDLSSQPHATVLLLPEPVMIAGEPRHRLYIQNFGFDPSLAPSGKSVMKVLLGTSARQWEALDRDPARYAEEKRCIVNKVLGALEQRFAGLSRQVEVVDVATPATTRRLTGNGPGFHLPMTRMARMLITGRRLSQTLPGLDRFHMVGQWAGVPGVSLVAAMGRDVAREICDRDGRRFAAGC